MDTSSSSYVDYPTNNTNTFTSEEIYQKFKDNITFSDCYKDSKKVYKFKSIREYVNFKENYIIWDTEPDTKTYPLDKTFGSSSKMGTECHIIEPAEYQYVYHNIVNDKNYMSNRGAVIRYHCKQYELKRGIYKHISKAKLLKLHIYDK